MSDHEEPPATAGTQAPHALAQGHTSGMAHFTGPVARSADTLTGTAR
ncbi:hypothetical protein [Streptomyces sp. WG-D5]